VATFISWRYDSDIEIRAYTYSPSSFFNGFQHHKVFVIAEEEEVEE
jgi:hypothetical protein